MFFIAIIERIIRLKERVQIRFLWALPTLNKVKKRGIIFQIILFLFIPRTILKAPSELFARR